MPVLLKSRSVGLPIACSIISPWFLHKHIRILQSRSVPTSNQRFQASVVVHHARAGPCPHIFPGHTCAPPVHLHLVVFVLHHLATNAMDHRMRPAAPGWGLVNG